MIRTVAKPLHIMMDVVFLGVSIVLAQAFRLNFPAGFRDILSFTPTAEQLAVIIGCAPLNIIAIYSLGLYDPDFKRNIFTVVLKQLLPGLVFFFMILSVSYFLQIKNIPRSIIVTYLAINYLCSTLFKIFVAYLNYKKWNTLIIGSSPRIPAFIEKLKVQKDIDITLCGVLNTESGQALSDLDKKIAEESIDMVLVFSENPVEKERILQSIKYATYRSCRVYMTPDSYEVLLAAPRYMRFCDVPFLRINTSNQSLFVIKRFFDFIFSIVLIVLLSPVFLAACIMIKLTSKGPVVFAQERVGKNGVPFVLYKFRSMYVNGNERTRKVEPGADPRLTPVGRFIRNLRMDELPQVFNILKGDMSFIGPRPLVPHEVEEGLQVDSWYRERFSILPGITGLAQVHGDYYTEHSDKIKYDLWYVFHYSMILDFQIVIRTLKTVILRKGS